MEGMTDTTFTDVRTDVSGNTAVVTLDRPKALNALNHPMITALAEALDTARADDRVTQVLLCSASEKAYCSGGDVRAVREDDLTGDFGPGDRLFRDEYDMNEALAVFPKPTVALVDGITMGGGLGVSAHADYRVITDRTWESMPEMAIGFVTDVGVSHAFTHLTGVPEESRTAVGLFLATTAYRMTPDDLLWSRMATHKVDDAAAFRDTLLADGVDAALATAQTAPSGTSELAENLDWITATFDGDDWFDIDRRLSAAGGEFADKVRTLLAPANPLSLVAATALLNHSARSTLREALDAELSLGMLLRRQPNFPEGVRAVLVDKDHDAQFTPATLAEVTEEQVAEIRRAVAP